MAWAAGPCLDNFFCCMNKSRRATALAWPVAGQPDSPSSRAACEVPSRSCGSSTGKNVPVGVQVPRPLT